eukprot:CAMPEP_0197624152 /NCGR_PEP_ID=MMETSP1338-20131121/3913_1 /TAXON_ID=43686 ORGANISM="Pelagodinium beii, Strain RCC1491" /NCGR_SAMPLE_ID=MMETSP1338 /ASSEMBLY_ACC=CAM_ASM_000754 /LENGTH=348 /DNA_ID=CAMNT_0043194253 /DNA_START=70 /DNA_END=1116 /DNA_ORIENTATION=+
MGNPNKLSDLDPAGATSSWLVLNVIVWFCSSIIFNITAAKLLSILPDAEDMTVLELLVTVVVGAVSLSVRGMRLLPRGGMSAYPGAFCLGTLHLVNCRSFVYSLQFIPTALAQTIRATNPIWVVTITSVVMGRSYSFPVMASLAPLVLGFAMTTGAEPSSLANPRGLVAAIFSVNAQVGVNLLGQKRLSTAVRGEFPHAFELQFTSCLFALAVLLPIWLGTGGAARLAGHWEIADPGARWQILSLTVIDGVLYFVEQNASFAALKGFQPLTFAVIDTLRRLSIVVVAGFCVQGTVVTASKAGGILLVMLGGLWFAYARELENRPRKSPQGENVLKEMKGVGRAAAAAA